MRAPQTYPWLGKLVFGFECQESDLVGSPITNKKKAQAGKTNS